MKLTPVIAYLFLVAALIAAFIRTEDGRQDQLADVARADVFICEENNRQDAVITAILRASVEERELDRARPELTAKEKALVRRSFRELVQQDCTTLPSMSRVGP